MQRIYLAVIVLFFTRLHAASALKQGTYRNLGESWQFFRLKACGWLCWRYNRGIHTWADRQTLDSTRVRSTVYHSQRTTALSERVRSRWEWLSCASSKLGLFKRTCVPFFCSIAFTVTNDVRLAPVYSNRREITFLQLNSVLRDRSIIRNLQLCQ